MSDGALLSALEARRAWRLQQVTPRHGEGAQAPPRGISSIPPQIFCRVWWLTEHTSS